MNSAIIMSDAAGYPNRATILRRTAKAAGIPFLLVSPADKPQPDSMVASIPKGWIPASKPEGNDRREWYRNHLHYVLAIKSSGIEVPYYWCVEADVAASPMAWLKLLEDTDSRTEDGLWTSLAHRVDSPRNGWFKNPTTPPDADWYCLGALFRLSRRAVEWLFESAAESREVFTEIHVPSEIARRGGTIGKINRDGSYRHYTCQTMMFTMSDKGYVFPPARNDLMFMHPVKHDAPTVGSNLLDIPNQFR